MNIAEKIIAYRKAKNLTQTQLADLLFVSDKTVSKWETGRGYPEISILPKLASVLGTTVDDLLQDDGSTPASLETPQSEAPSTDLPPVNVPPSGESYETKFVLPRAKSLIVWICTVFIPMGLFVILSLAVMISGYSNAMETGLLVLLVNGLCRGIIALMLYLSFRDSRALLIYAIFSLVFSSIAMFSNTTGFAFGSLTGLLWIANYLLGVAVDILIILFALRKVKKAKSLVILLWVNFGIGMLSSLITFRTNFFINTLNDVIMILAGISTVIGFTQLFPRFEMRKVPVRKKSTFFQDPVQP